MQLKDVNRVAPHRTVVMTIGAFESCKLLFHETSYPMCFRNHDISFMRRKKTPKQADIILQCMIATHVVKH